MAENLVHNRQNGDVSVSGVHTWDEDGGLRGILPAIRPEALEPLERHRGTAIDVRIDLDHLKRGWGQPFRHIGVRYKIWLCVGGRNGVGVQPRDGVTFGAGCHFRGRGRRFW